MQKPVILIIEDDRNDQFLLQNAFSYIGVKDPVHLVCDGAEAIEYLKGSGQYFDRNVYQFPTLILLDLKMPKMNGFEFLQYVKDHPALMVIPTIVFTSSNDPDDVKCAFLLGANSYIAKAKSFDGICDQLKFIYGYWMRTEIPLIDREGKLLKTRHAGKLSEKIISA